MRLTIHTAISVAALVWLSGCNVYDANLVDSGSASLPARPAADTSSGEDAVESTFALYNFSLDQGEQWRRFGLDLDGLVTNSVEDPAECLAANGRPQLDGEKGIDNSFGQHVLPTVLNLASCIEDDIALNQARGLGTLLLRVRGWNGTRDDAQVDVAIFASVDGTSLDDVSATHWGGDDGTRLLVLGSSSPAPAPAWDGGDFFFVDPDSVIDGDLGQPKALTSDAYVSKGRLVVPVDAETTFLFRTGLGSFPILMNGFLIADLSEDGETITKGLLTGRLAAEEVISSLFWLGVCDEGLRGSIVTIVRDNLDLNVTKGAAEPDNACTATGLSFGFMGLRALLTPTVAPVSLPVPTPCVGAGGAPTFNFCCPSVAANSSDLLPSDCSVSDLSAYENPANPIPVPLVEGF